MIVLHLVLLFLSVLLFAECYRSFRAVSHATLLCPLIRAQTLRLVGASMFVSAAFFVLEARWVAMGFGQMLPQADEMTWALLRGAKLLLLHGVVTLCRQLAGCDPSTDHCLLNRRRQDRRGADPLSGRPS